MYAVAVDHEQAEKQLRILEHRYRTALNHLTSAQAHYEALTSVMAADSVYLLNALRRVSQAKERLADLTAAIEAVEECVDD